MFILLIQLTNGAQFLNNTPLFLSSVYLAAALSPTPVIVIVPFTSTYASEKLHKLDLSILVLSLILLPVYVPHD